MRETITTTTNGFGKFNVGKSGNCMWTPEQRTMIVERFTEYRKTCNRTKAYELTAKHFNIEGYLKPASVYKWFLDGKVLVPCRLKAKVIMTSEILGEIKSIRKDNRPEFTDKQKKIMCDLFTKHISNGDTQVIATSKVRDECGTLNHGPTVASLRTWSNIKVNNVKKSTNKRVRKSFKANTQPIGDNGSDIKERIKSIANLAKDADLEELSQCMILIKQVSKTIATALQVELQKFTDALG